MLMAELLALKKSKYLKMDLNYIKSKLFFLLYLISLSCLVGS
jgi:hypothetical protein